MSPSRRRVTAAAAADPIDRMPTVKEMHLQRAATMAAAAATAQMTNADVESHEQFAKELRSYRSQMPGEGGRAGGGARPLWESDVGEGGAFEAGNSHHSTVLLSLPEMGSARISTPPPPPPQTQFPLPSPAWPWVRVGGGGEGGRPLWEL